MNTLVIGASGFIGQAITKNLKQRSGTVYSTYHKNQINDSFEFDLMNDEHINSLSKKISKLDAIIFCAAPFEKEVFNSARNIENGNQFESLDMALGEKIIQANGIQPMKVIQKLLPTLKRSEKPNIIFLGSLVGQKATPSPIIHALAKSFISAHLGSLSKELGYSKILVNSINPGILNGGISEYLKTKIIQDYKKHTALKRFGEAAEVANTVEWIVHNNTYITGQPFLLDGGL